MAKPGFYNDNEYRAYPFIAKRPVIAIDACGVPDAAPNTAAIELPHSSVVDAGFIMGLDSKFDARQHYVYLAKITRTGNQINFEFRTNAPGASSKLISFTRNIDDSEWLIEYVSASPGEPECAIEPAWEGFLVTGPLSDLAELLPNAGEILLTPQDYVIEPGRIQSLIKSYVRTINIGNYARITAKNPDCLEESTADEERQIIVNARCMAGDLKLKEGYNCLIQQINRSNTLRVGVGATTVPPEAELCEYGSELPLFAGEIPPPGSKFLSGGPACDEVISTINGVGGPNVQLAGGTGVKIVTTQNENKILVQLAKNALTTEGCE